MIGHSPSGSLLMRLGRLAMADEECAGRAAQVEVEVKTRSRVDTSTEQDEHLRPLSTLDHACIGDFVTAPVGPAVDPSTNSLPLTDHQHDKRHTGRQKVAWRGRVGAGEQTQDNDSGTPEATAKSYSARCRDNLTSVFRNRIVSATSHQHQFSKVPELGSRNRSSTLV